VKYDPRYESARATSQSERGWDFRPAPKRQSGLLDNLLAFAGFMAFMVVVFLFWVGLR